VLTTGQFRDVHFGWCVHADAADIITIIFFVSCFTGLDLGGVVLLCSLFLRRIGGCRFSWFCCLRRGGLPDLTSLGRHQEKEGKNEDEKKGGVVLWVFTLKGMTLALSLACMMPWGGWCGRLGLFLPLKFFSFCSLVVLRANFQL